MTLLTYDTTAAAAQVRQVLAAFKSASGSSVTLDTLPGSGAAIYPGKLRTELLGGKGPDVFRMWGGQIAGPFVTASQVVDLTPYYAKYGWNNTLASGAIKDFTYNGKPYGVPLWASSVGVWYNLADFKKAGIAAPPTTYADLVADNAKLKAVGIQPWLAGGEYGWDVMRFFEYFLESTAGPTVHDQLLAGKTSWNIPAVVTAFTRLKQWADQGWFPKGVLALDPTQVEAEMTQNKGAMALDGQWIEGNISMAKMTGQFGTFIPPTDQTPLRYSGFTEGLFIPTTAKNPAASAALINYFTSVKAQETIQNAYTTVKAVPDDTTNFPLTADWKKISQTNTHYLIQDQALTASQANAYFDLQSKVIQGSITPAAAAKAMDVAMKAGS